MLKGYLLKYEIVLFWFLNKSYCCIEFEWKLLLIKFFLCYFIVKLIDLKEYNFVYIDENILK